MEENINFEKFVDDKLKAAEEAINVWKQIKLLLNSEAIKKSTGQLNSTLAKVSRPYTNEEHKDYPYRKSVVSKVNFLMNRERRALRFPEIIGYITEIEGEKVAKRISVTLSSNLSNMVKKGMVILCQYNHERKLSFYIKPEWRTEDKRNIKEDFKPSPEALAGTPEEKLHPENIFWKDNLGNITIQ